MLAQTQKQTTETHKNTTTKGQYGTAVTTNKKAAEPSDYELRPFELWFGNRLIDAVVIGAFIVRPENIMRIKIALFTIAFFSGMVTFSIWINNKSLGY